MNEQSLCITKDRKAAKIEWEDDSNFLPALYIVKS